MRNSNKIRNMTTEIYYSVRGGGDGSAYPTFMETLELAEWDQDHLSEGWGESCTGSITIKSETKIESPDIETIEDYYFENYGYEGFNDKHGVKEQFIKEFFPNGLPNTLKQ